MRRGVETPLYPCEHATLELLEPVRFSQLDERIGDNAPIDVLGGKVSRSRPTAQNREGATNLCERLRQKMGSLFRCPSDPASALVT